MDARQENRATRFVGLRDVFDNAVNKALWSLVPLWVLYDGHFRALLDLVGALAAGQGINLKGITITKEDLALALITDTLAVSGPCAASAGAIGDETLYAKVHLNATKLGALRDTLLDDACQVIHDLVAETLAAAPADTLTPAGLPKPAVAAKVALADSGINQIQLDTLQTRIDAYKAAVGSPMTAVQGRKDKTDQLAAALNTLDRIKERGFDQLILQWPGTAFAREYKNASPVPKAPGGHASPAKKNAATTKPAEGTTPAGEKAKPAS